MKLFSAFSDTFEVIAFRIASIRGFSQKTILVIAAILGLGFIYLFTSTGTALKYLALNSTETIPPDTRDLALGYLNVFLADGGVLTITAALTALLGSLFLVPLIGYSFSGFIPSGDLVSVRKNDYYKITDGILIQFISSISLVQLFFITFLNSILVDLSTKPGLGILFGWGIWVAVVLLTSLVAWTFEYMHRKIGSWSKYAVIGVLVLTGLILFLVRPDDTLSLFGLSETYGAFVSNLDTLSGGALFGILALFLALYLLIVFATVQVGSLALSVPERTKKTNLKKAFSFGGLGGPTWGPLLFLIGNVVRQKNIRKPIILAAGFSFVAIFLFGGSFQILISLVFIAPLIVSMSWGTNTFGILGGGTIWLLSLPSLKENILRYITFVQFFIIFFIQGITVALLTIFYNAPLAQSLSFLIATATASVIMTRSALEKTVLHPERYRVHLRGESVLPPLKALAYLGRFILGAGLIGLVSFVLGNLLIQTVLLVAVILYQLLRYRQLQSKWMQNSEIATNIVKVVGE